MISFKLMVLLLCVSAAGLYKTTHAEFVNLKTNNATDIKNKENKTVIEPNKNISVETGLNLEKALAQLNGTEASNLPKIRKVTPVDVDNQERKLKTEENVKENKSVSTTTTMKSPQINKILTEAGVIDIKSLPKDSANSTLKVKKNGGKAATNESIRKTDSNSTDQVNMIAKLDKHSNTITAATVTKSSPSSNATVKPIISPAANITKSHETSSVANSTISKENGSSSSFTGTTTTSTTTTTTSTTTTTTTTTTPKPKKPTVTYSIPDFPDLEKDNPEFQNLLQSSSSNKVPTPDVPYAQPSQEFNGNFHRGRDFILPIVSMIFIIPLVIGIIITSYRRFRDCWSTRHYRRMDFLVDGMYND